MPPLLLFLLRLLPYSISDQIFNFRSKINTMSTVLSIKFTPISLRTLFTRNSRTCFCKPPFPPSLFSNRSFAAKIHASSTAFVEAKPEDPIVVKKEAGAGNNNLACPICFEPLTWNGDSVLSIASTAGSRLQCNTCKKTYSGNETHIDLTAASGSIKYVQYVSPITEFFRLPLISFLYERGWRQNFLWLGFPGPEKEFEMMKDYLKPVLGGNIIDASCGSGLFSRLFAKSGLFSHVVALDYSENMLQQCYEFIEKEENFPKEKVTLIRAEISRLPFVSSSIDAVHAGAAMHCWPSPSTAVAEISRILRPGGVLVATTYILDGPYAFFPHLRIFRENITAISGNQTFLSEHEVEEICRTCGLVDFTRKRNRRFVMFSARKPN